MIDSTIKILQVNLNRNQIATESALQLAVELNIDLIVIQEPWLIRGPPDDFSNTRSVNHPSFTAIFPLFNTTQRPRVMAFISRSLKSTISINRSPTSLPDPDFLVLDATEGENIVQLINIYNEQRNDVWAVDRCLYRYPLTNHTILTGDFNLHHPWWDPLDPNPTAAKAEVFVEWIEDQGMALINEPGQGTFYRSHMTRESTIDLTFASESIANKVTYWQVNGDAGSDHYAVIFTLRGAKVDLVDSPMAFTRFNTEKADWSLFDTTLKAKAIEWERIHGPRLRSLASLAEGSTILSQKVLDCDHEITDDLDRAAQAFTGIVSEAAHVAIPKTMPGARAKPWWNPELMELRKAMNRHQRDHKACLGDPNSDGTAKIAYLKARNTYFLAIKQAKRAH